MWWSGEHWSPRRLQRVVLLALLFLFIAVFETEITSGWVFRFGCFTCRRLTWMLGGKQFEESEAETHCASSGKRERTLSVESKIKINKNGFWCFQINTLQSFSQKLNKIELKLASIPLGKNQVTPQLHTSISDALRFNSIAVFSHLFIWEQNPMYTLS